MAPLPGATWTAKAIPPNGKQGFYDLYVTVDPSDSTGNTAYVGEIDILQTTDGGTTWTYAPASGAGGAPAGYDGNVTNVQWNFTGSLGQTAPNNTGSVSFVARIK